MLAVLALTACASRGVRRDQLAALAAADALIARGCYDCLLEARATFDRLSRSRYIPADSLARRLFETDLLLSLRAKELQLDWAPSLYRAREVARRLDASHDAGRFLAAVDAVPPDATGRMNDWTTPFRRERAAFAARVPEEVRWLGESSFTPAVREYIALSLDCSHDARVLAPRAQPGSRDRRPVMSPDASPLVMYGTAICLRPDTNMLAAVLVHEPRFHEAAYFAGTVAAFRSVEEGPERAASLLAQAFARFPRSPAVAYISGWNLMSVNDCALAKRFFDTTVVIDASHELALLNGTVCRSRLREDSAALAMATRLIALDGGSTQQGYYWRAVSQLRLRNLTAARTDIEEAKRLEREANALTVAGVIENEQDDLVIAESDLREALRLPRGDSNCTAAWTLGLVIGKANRPAEAADAFEGAMRCYDTRVALADLEIQRVREAPSRNAAFRQRRLDALVAETEDLRTRYHASAFNAAGHRANAGNVARGLELLDIAARDARLTQAVRKVRDAIARHLAP